MNYESSSVFSIAAVSNIDSLLLRAFRILPGRVDSTVPPYFDVVQQEVGPFLPTTPFETHPIKGLGYFINCTPVPDAFPYLVFKSTGVCRLLAHARLLELRDTGICIWSDHNNMDTGVSVDIYWIRRPSYSETELRYQENVGAIQELFKRVQALEGLTLSSQGSEIEDDI